MATERPLHILEPTLSNEAGHCQSFVQSVCDAGGAAAAAWTVWGGRRASLRHFDGVIESFFFRRVRRVQEFFLLRRLLPRGERIFVATAGRVDLVLLDLAASSPIRPGQVLLFFHWVNATPAKLAFFAKMARKHPELEILGPTRSVVDVFTACGFKHCRVVPYPITRPEGETPQTTFRHLLYAGAARSDKGFGHVVDLIALLARRGAELPVSLQTSADHNDKYDSQTREALERLSAIRYAGLRLTPETLSREAFFESFLGAICLQPYDQAAFADRISGITLDGLSMGAPLVTLAGTWMARVVERFGCGVVLDAPAPEALLGAVETIVDGYAGFQARARTAGETLQREHSAAHLCELLTR